jgi:hypothetical protein
MSTKLSPLAQELYAAMQKGMVCYFKPYMGQFNPCAYYYRDDNAKRCTRQAQALLKAGLVERFDDTWRGHKLRVKQAAQPTTQPTKETTA